MIVKKKDQHCKKCKNYTTEDPIKCEYYSTCKKQKKIRRYLKENFPVICTEENLYKNIQNEIDEHPVSIEQIILPEEPLKYFSIRIMVYGTEKIEKSKEIWRCKTENEANILAGILDDFKYYWIPLETTGHIFIEEVEV